MCERKRRRRSFLSASGESGFGWAPGAEAREVGGECVRGARRSISARSERASGWERIWPLPRTEPRTV